MTTGLGEAFRLAAAELGLASAAWLFVEEVAAAEGAPGVAALREELGPAWPVLDAICASWSAGARAPLVDAAEVLPRLADAPRIVVVGLETTWLDALLAALPAATKVGLVRHLELAPSWERVLSNWAGRVELLELATFQSWAGPRSALLTFVYAARSDRGPFGLPTWLRVAGPDVRTQFRTLLGWDVLRAPFERYPRWLTPIDVESLTHLEPAP